MAEAGERSATTSPDAASHEVGASADAPNAPSRRRRLRRALDVRRGWAFLTSRSRQGARRAAGSAFSIFESAVAAAIAWSIGAYLLHRPDPIFAAIAAWVCLGFKPDRTPRKVAELGAGATLGVALGDLAVHVTTIGPIQIVVLIMIAGLAGRFFDSGDLFTMQSGVNAIVILGFASTLGPGVVADRWMDALAGAGMAFVVAVLMPRRPTERPRRYARSLLAEYAVLLDMLAAGLRHGDVSRLAELQGQRDAVGRLHAEFEETLKTAREVTRLNPTLRRYRREVSELDRVFRLTKRALRSTDMLSRQSLGMTEEVGAHLTEIGEPVGRLAMAAHRLAGAVGHWHQPEQAREILTALASGLAPDEVEDPDWRPVALMSLVRALTVDLLQLSGLSKTEARAALADTRGRPFAGEAPGFPEDRHSTVWE